MKLFEVAAPEYIYHASHTPGNDTKRLIKSIYDNDLQPSKEGYSGPGTYFAYEPDGKVYDHTDPNYATLLRVRFADVASVYGVYPKNENGIERDDEEIIVPGPVDAEMIEVETKPGVWEPLYDVYQELYYETI